MASLAQTPTAAEGTNDQRVTPPSQWTWVPVGTAQRHSSHPPWSCERQQKPHLPSHRHLGETHSWASDTRSLSAAGSFQRGARCTWAGLQESPRAAPVGPCSPIPPRDQAALQSLHCLPPRRSRFRPVSPEMEPYVPKHSLTFPSHTSSQRKGSSPHL